MRKFFLVMALALAACASDEKAPAPTPPPVAAPPPLVTPPPVASAPAVPLPPASDQCGAYELQGLVGQPRQSIPVPINPSKRRVVCSTCPMTMDFSPDRLTIVYDAQTGLVTKVQCN